MNAISGRNDCRYIQFSCNCSKYSELLTKGCNNIFKGIHSFGGLLKVEPNKQHASGNFKSDSDSELWPNFVLFTNNAETSVFIDYTPLKTNQPKGSKVPANLF